MKKLLFILLTVGLLFGFVPVALAETDLTHFSMESEIDTMAMKTVGDGSEREGKNFIYDISVDRENGTAEVYYAAEESAFVSVNFYNDYETEDEKTLLFTLGPVSVSPQNGSIKIPYTKNELPQYFEIESKMVTVSGETTSYKTSTYSEALQFALNATAEDFPKGYYVEVNSSNAPKLSNMPGLMKSAGTTDSKSVEITDGDASGYYAYNTDLILLSPDTEYTVADGKQKNQVVFEDMPEELAGMSEEELMSVKGFVIPNEDNTEGEVFLLNDGLTLTPEGFSMKVKEPESLDDMFAAMNITMAAKASEKKEKVDKSGITGTVTRTEDVSVKIVRHKWKLDLEASVGVSGSFSLNMSRATISGVSDPKFYDNPPGQVMLFDKPFEGNISFSYSGFGMSTDTNFYAACTAPVYIAGDYGFLLYFSVGFSGLKYGARKEEVRFSEVTPLTPNRNTYAYFGRQCRFHMKGFYFDFKIFEIGPVFDEYIDERVCGRTIAKWEQLDTPQETGEDIIHTCIQPTDQPVADSSGKPIHGCISGMAGSLIRYSLNFKVDLFFWDHSWKIAEKTDAEEEPDVDYFYRSLTHDDNERKHGTNVECPHQLYRISAETTENVRTELPHSVISSAEGAIDTEYSETTTGDNGISPAIYLKYKKDKTYTLKAVDEHGDFISEEKVTPQDLIKHRRIVFDRNGKVIHTVNIKGAYFPNNVGNKLYAGKSVQTGETNFRYFPYFQMTEGTHEDDVYAYGTAMSAKWSYWKDGEWVENCPDSETMLYAQDGVNRCEFVIDFSTYGDGTYKLDDTPWVMIMGQEGGNPVTCSDGFRYRFAITGYQVSDKYYDDGKVQRNCILTVQAEFIVGEDDYVIVNVLNGLNSLSGHFYKAGDTAIAIGKDIGNAKNTIVRNLIPKLSSQTWSPTEKEKLKDEVYAQGEYDPFIEWRERDNDTLSFPESYSPVISPDGTLNYNAALFTVPEGVKKITISARYGWDDERKIKSVNTEIKQPVPGESFDSSDYRFGKLSTDPGECHVEGLEGEKDGQVKLVWKEGGNVVSGKIRYNSAYTVEGRIRPKINTYPEYYYGFLYPLATENGTKAYVTPILSTGKGETEEALRFELLSPIPADPELELPIVRDASAIFTYYFETPMAQLLEVIQPDDLYYPEGIQASVINAYLKSLPAGILTEDETITSANVKWEKVTEVPGAGESFTVKGKLIRPDEIRNEEEPEHPVVDENVTVTIHIYGADRLEPPTAKPVPAVYRSDIHVELSQKDPNAYICYRVIGESSSFSTYSSPISLVRKPNAIATYTIEAYTEKKIPAEESESGKEETIQSETVSFTYTLIPSNTEFVLTVVAGSASSIESTGTGQLYISAGSEVTLSPIDDEELVFLNWKLDHTPEGFEWIDDTDSETPNARFKMPAEDITITGYYYPKEGKRIITDLMAQVQYIHKGDEKAELPEHDIDTSFRIQIGDSRVVAPAPVRMISTTVDEATNLWWNVEDCEFPVTYGTYPFDAIYLINPEENSAESEDASEEKKERVMPKDLVHLCQEQLPKKGYAYERYIQTKDRFAPFLTASVKGNSVPVIVSEDGKRAMIHYEFNFPPETYTLRYDPNGGEYNEVPKQVIQLKNTPTELTDKEPSSIYDWTFLGWSRDPEATEPEYKYDPAQEPPVTFDTDTTLYAVWKKYEVEVRWLDADNSENTRKAFTVTFEDGTPLTIDPKDATEVNGVGISTYTVTELTYAPEHSITADGLENGYIDFGKVNGKEDIYAVSTLNEDGKMVITLTAKRKLHVEKKWEIDFEDHDRPKSVKMILQNKTPLEEESTKLMRLLLAFISDSSSENRDSIISEVEKIIGYSLKGLSPEAMAGKVMHLITAGELTPSNLTDALKGLLTADTDDSDVDGKKWYAWQTVNVTENNDWKADFAPTERFKSTVTVLEDGSIAVVWNGEMEYRVVEKAGKSPVENGKDAVFTVPEYTNIVGNTVEEHKTVYMVKYSTKDDTTTVTNTAVEDHYLLKEWLMLGEAKKPENVYAALLWQYDPDYLEAAQSLIGVEMPGFWMPEDNPIKGTKVSVEDILKSVLPIDIPIPFADKIKIPLAIAKLNEGNDWRGYFRVKKYGNFGLPLKHEGAEFFGAICQDIMKYFLGVDIPLGINPLQGFITVSVPEIDVPFTTDKLDAIGNTWYKGGDDDDDDKPNKIGGSKIWKDDNDSDGIRPDSITLHIYEDGIFKVDDIVVKRSDNPVGDRNGHWVWTYKSDSIDTKKHSYTVTEDTVDGYKTKIDGLNITNTHTSEKQKHVSLSVKKVWDEETPALHSAVNVKVLRNSELLQTVNLSEANDWYEQLLELDKADENGKTYSYSVEEDPVPDGYTVQYNIHFDSEKNEWVCYITNTPAETGKTVIKGKKIWDDKDDQLGVRPESVTIHLFANETETESIVLNKVNAWSWSREVDEKDKEGNKITYTVTEDPVKYYETTIDGLNVTNSLDVPETEKINVEVIKEWDGTDAEYPSVPVNMQLLRNGEEYKYAFTLNEENGWRKLFEGLDKEDSKGNEYNYGVKEVKVPDGFSDSYSIRYDSVLSRLILTVTNKRIGPDEVEIGGDKTWNDQNDKAGVRPKSVEYLILANGETVGREVLNANTEWKWSGIYPKTDDKGIIKYSVEELPIRFYKATYSQDRMSVTNSLELATVTVEKNWSDNKNHAGIRPEYVEVVLMAAANGEEPIEVKIVKLTGGSKETKWSDTFTVPDKDERGRELQYSIKEVAVENYSSTLAEPIHDANKHTWKFSITNTISGSLKVTNTVLHGDKVSPMQFTIELEDEDGNAFTGTLDAELTHDGETTACVLTFSNGESTVMLAHGDSIVCRDIVVGWRYTVREQSPYGYRTWVIDEDNEVGMPLTKASKAATPDGDKGGSYPEYTTAIKKYGENLADFYNDTEFTVRGQKRIDGVNAGAAEEGLFTFELLYSDMTPVMNDDGIPLIATNGADGTFSFTANEHLTEKTVFYVREVMDAALAEKYVMDTDAHPVTVQADSANRLTAVPDPVIINNSTKVKFTVYKHWADSPGGEITLNLFANGSPVSGYTPLRNGNTYTYSDLPRSDENGNIIVWSATEVPISGFKASYKNVGEWSDKTDAAYNEGTITNRTAVHLTIYKQWKGNNKHPNSITIDIYRNGELYRTETVKPHSDGSMNFTLPKYNHDMEEVVYTFTEQPIEGYTTKYENISPHETVTDIIYDGGKIINVYKGGPVPITGDNTPILPILATLLTSVIGLCILILILKRDKKKEE